MAFKIPDFAAVGFDDPRAAGRLPQYPSDDPGAVGLATFGKGVQAAAGAALDIAADRQRRANQVNSALAEADLTANLFRTKEAIKVERDPAKVDELKGQLAGFLDRAGATITDPDARELWTAKHRVKVAEVEGAADHQQRLIWNDRFLAGSAQQLDEQVKIAAQASDEAEREGAKRRIGEIIGAMRDAGVISAAKAQELGHSYGQNILVGTVNWLDANERQGEASAFLDRNAPLFDPDRLRTMRDHLRPRVDRDVARTAADRALRGEAAPIAGDFADRVIGIESGGRDDARNPRSSATGAGQFIDSTWLATIKAAAPEIAAGKSDAELLALRRDRALNRRMVDAYAAQNRATLEAQGLPTDDGALYLAHFLGPAGAATVLKAAPGTPMRDLFSADVINANPQLARMTAGDLRAMTARRMGTGSAGKAPSGGEAAEGPPEAGTFYNADDAERRQPMHYERAGGGWKIVPGPAPEGQPAPAASAQPAGPPDWRGAVDRINADTSLSRQQRDLAIAEVHRRQNQLELGQEQAKSDLLLRIGKGEASREDIEALYRDQKISPAARTQAHTIFDKLESERAAIAEGVTRVTAAGNGGAPLDPKSKTDRDALNFHFNAVSGAWEKAVPDQMLDRSVAYAVQYGLVPDKLKATIRGGLHSGRAELAVQAASTVERLRNANPQLLGEIGDENDLRLATLISTYTAAGVPADAAVRMSVDGLKVNKTDRDARSDDFDAQRGKTQQERQKADDTWIAGQKNSLWVDDPNVDPMMRKEFEDVARAEYQRTGNLEAARRLALDNIDRVWGRSWVGGDLRYMKFAPEKFYGVPTLSADENSRWMSEQLLADVTRGAFQDPRNPITADRLRLLPAPDRTRVDGLPVYQVWLNRDGAWTQVVDAKGAPISWFPDWNGSEEFKRRDAQRQSNVDFYRRQRGGAAAEAATTPPPVTLPVRRPDITLPLSIGP